MSSGCVHVTECSKSVSLEMYGGPYLQTQQTILETQHNIFETQVNICDTQHKITEAQVSICETQHKIIETQRKINYQNTTQNN